MIGQTLNQRFKILSRLGMGGMGEVYLAQDEQTKSQVAVKILARQLTSHPEALERFRREAKTLRQVEHPNIVKFMDAFEHDEQFVIVMEYVGGGSLFDLLKKGALPIERARQIALDLCDALIRAHRLNIIHRDIKPENVLIDEDGTPKLADFGVARLSEGTRMTRSGTQVGTPYYMSPEAWEGKPLDAQADIWSLGVMLFEMLSGQVPFNGDTPPMVMNKIFTSDLPDLKKLRNDVPSDLEKIVTRMLAKDKSERYKTMRQVAVELEGGEPMIPAKVKKPAPASRVVSPKFPLFDFRKVNIGAVFIAIILVILFAANYLINFFTNRSGLPTQFAIVTKIVTQTHTPSIGSITVSETDGMNLMFVPAGEFTMGNNTSIHADERPEHQVYLDAFWIDQTEVTNAMYAKCVSENGCSPPDSSGSYTRTSYFGTPNFNNYPVINVSWNDAQDYCEWASRRLPTEAEWEKAARGTEGRTYPWGNADPKSTLLNFDVNLSDITGVGSYSDGMSIYAVLDMSGNVWEWVSSLYQPYPYDATDGRENLTATDRRVLRGGSWSSTIDDIRSANRNRNNPSNSSNYIGFRCALSP